MVNGTGFARVFPLRYFNSPQLKLFGRFANLLLCTRSAARVVENHPELVMFHILRDPTGQKHLSQNILRDSAGKELVRDSLTESHSNVFYSDGERPEGVKFSLERSINVPNYPSVLNALKIIDDNNVAEGKIWGDLGLQKRLEREEGCRFEAIGRLTIYFDKNGAAYQSSDLFDVYEFFFNYTQSNPDVRNLPILDMGSGLGHTSFMLSLFFENVFGIEQSEFLAIESLKTKQRLSDSIIGNVDLNHGDYFDHDLSGFKLVYIFRDRDIFEIIPRFKSLAPGTRIFMYCHEEDFEILRLFKILEFTEKYKRDHIGARAMHIFERT